MVEGVCFDVDGMIFVLMYQYGDDVWFVGLQKIMLDGVKCFNKGMEKKGVLYLFGEVGVDDQIVLVVEGYVIVCLICMLIDDVFVVNVCFDVGGIFLVVCYLWVMYLNVYVLVCVDDDWKIEQCMCDWFVDEFGFWGDLVFGVDLVWIEVKNMWYMIVVLCCCDDNGVLYVEVSYGNDVMLLCCKCFENMGLKCVYEVVVMVVDVSVVYLVFVNCGECKLIDFNDLYVEEGIGFVQV